MVGDWYSHFRAWETEAHTSEAAEGVQTKWLPPKTLPVLIQHAASRIYSRCLETNFLNLNRCNPLYKNQYLYTRISVRTISAKSKRSPDLKIIL